MNARELLAELEKMNPLTFDEDERERYRITHSALRLLAAAEANGGATLESEAMKEECYEAHDPREVWEQFARRLELERNGLAARVAELEEECSAADIYGRTSASHGFINAPKWHELADETKSLYRESAARSNT